MFEDSFSGGVPSSVWATMTSWLTPTVLFVLLNIMIGTIAISSSLGSNNKNSNQQQQQNQEHGTSHPRQLARSPSMLQRLKSMNLYVHRSQEPNAVYQDLNIHYSQQHPSYQVQEQEQVQVQSFFTRSPSMLQRLKSIRLYSSYTSQEEKTTDALCSSQRSHQEDEKAAAAVAEPEQEHDEDNNNENDMTFDEVYSHVSRTKSDTAPVAGELLPKLPRKMKKSASVTSAFSHFEESDIVETRRPATVREGKASTMTAVEADAEVDAKADDFINKFKKQLKLQRIDSIIRYKEMITRGTAN